MKAIFVLVTMFGVSTAFASTYTCKGEDSKSAKKTELTFDFSVSPNLLKVTDPDGTEIELKIQDSNRSTATYADYGYDGYGGFVSVKVPVSVSTATSVVQDSFKATYATDVYSEIGRVLQVRVTGTCNRSK